MRPTLQTVPAANAMEESFKGEARPVLSRREPGKAGAVTAGYEVQAPVSLQGGWGGVGDKEEHQVGRTRACLLTCMKRTQNQFDPPEQCLENCAGYCENVGKQCTLGDGHLHI